MVTDDTGLNVTLDGDALSEEILFSELPGRAVVETTDPDAVREAVGDVPVTELGASDDSGAMSVSVGSETLEYASDAIAETRGHITRTLD